VITCASSERADIDPCVKISAFAEQCDDRAAEVRCLGSKGVFVSKLQLAANRDKARRIARRVYLDRRRAEAASSTATTASPRIIGKSQLWGHYSTGRSRPINASVTMFNADIRAGQFVKSTKISLFGSAINLSWSEVGVQQLSPSAVMNR